MENIPGIGPIMAEKLKKKGITNESQLLSSKIFKELNLQTQYFLLFKPEKKIEYKIVDAINSIFKENLIHGIIAGSYRRKQPYMRDIDFISFSPYEKVVEKLNHIGIILETYSHGSEKSSSIIDFSNFKNNNNNNNNNSGNNKELEGKKYCIDIWFPKKEERLFYLLHCTGSSSFNLILRKKLKRINPCKKHKNCRYLLSQHGLFIIHNIDKKENMTRTRVNIKSEKEIFKIAGMRYLKPEERNYKK